MNLPDIGGRSYVTPAILAERYRCCLATVYIWDREGIMPKCWKQGRRRGWWFDEIEAWEQAGFPSREETGGTEPITEPKGAEA